ncbi:MAG: serine protease [Planctomycetota bacterium]
MKRVMLLVLVLIFATETPSAQREEKGIEIVFKAQDKQINPYQEEYEKLLYPTVRINSPAGTGSGVVISNTNHTNRDELTRIDILSAAHVVNDQNVVDIEFYNSEIITGTVVITDTIRDLAIIRVICGIRDIRVIYSARLAPKDYTPYIFTPIYTVGCSLGLSPRPSTGIISVIDKDHWEVSSPVLPGNSGGPVYDARTYEVIGIAVWVKVYQYQLVTTMAGIVPINQIYEFLKPQWR